MIVNKVARVKCNITPILNVDFITSRESDHPLGEVNEFQSTRKSV